jgi:hypothetical protein
LKGNEASSWLFSRKKGNVCILIDVAMTGISRRKSRRDATMQESMHSDAAIVESELCDYSSYNWRHLKGNESLKKHLGEILGKHSIDL